MIIIHAPEIKEENDFAIISSKFSINEEEEVLWYKIPSKFGTYLEINNLDAFLVGLLFKALQSGNDIHVKGCISSRLYYTLSHYVINALCFTFPEFRKIKIFCDDFTESDYNEINVSGTALSCGVDSLATYFDHVQEKGKHQIKYFTFLNVGSHGDFGGDNARAVFLKRLKSVKSFAHQLDIEIIPIDSNLSEILNMKFQETYNLRNISPVLLLQKLFKNYYYASGTRFDHFKMNRHEIADTDMLIIPNLSTESTNFFPAAVQYNRIERTELISNFPSTYNFLDVCVSLLPGKNKLNCSTCYKCMRTQLTLEIIGKLHLYQKVFDLDLYEKNKNSHLGWLLSKRNKLTLDIEFIKFMRANNYRISTEAYIYTLRFFFYRIRKKYFRSA